MVVLLKLNFYLGYPKLFGVSITLFNIEPKSRREDAYGFNHELEMLIRFLENLRLILVTDLKRAGVSLGNTVDKALNLHAYQHNGFEPSFSTYDRIELVIEYINEAITAMPKLIERYFLEKYGELTSLIRHVRTIEMRKSSD